MKRILSRVKRKIKKAVKSRLSKPRVKLRIKSRIKITKASKAIKQKSKQGESPSEVKIGQAKFHVAPQAEQVKGAYAEFELPGSYAKDRIVLQVRDPWWLHTYWEINQSTWEGLSRKFPAEAKSGFKQILRVYDVSQIEFSGNNAHRFFDIEINNQANNWYIDTRQPGRSWCVDFGIRLSDGRFITLLRSNRVTTPPSGPCGIIDEEWMIPEELFNRLYKLGVGMGSSPLKPKQLWEARLKREIGSGGISSLASPVKKSKA